MPGGRLPETENKRICQISGPKSGRGRLRNLRSGRLRESFWNSVFLRNKTVICNCKVVSYGRWSLTRSGRYERIDCIFLFAGMEKGIKYSQDQSSMMLLFEHNFRHNAVVSFVVLRVTL